ncbi:MAG: hypothetical protein M3Q05_04715 [Bacteroidota bacterium]|nr:hypothetical protein [Bacteroidota bacterium]
MKNKTLGILALIGAPALLIGMHLEQAYKSLSDSWFTGVWGIIYISAWIASIIALRRIEATGKSQFGRTILWVITGTLILANISNVYQLIAPQDKSILFLILDSFWPISNLIMLVVGITVIKAKVLTGWKRYVPLVVGLWFPLTMLTMALAGRDAPIMVFVPYYTAVAWSSLAIVVITTEQKAISQIPEYQTA